MQRLFAGYVSPRIKKVVGHMLLVTLAVCLLAGAALPIAYATSLGNLKLTKWGSYGDNIKGYYIDETTRSTNEYYYAMNLCHLDYPSNGPIMADLVYCIEAEINFQQQEGYSPELNLPFGNEEAKKIAWIVLHGFRPDKGARPYLPGNLSSPQFGNNDMSWSTSPSVSRDEHSNIAAIRQRYPSLNQGLPGAPTGPHPITELEAFMGTQLAIWEHSSHIPVYDEVFDHIAHDPMYDPKNPAYIDDYTVERRLNSLVFAEALIIGANDPNAEIEPSISISFDKTGARLNGSLYGPVTLLVDITPSGTMSINNIPLTPATIPILLAPMGGFTLYQDAAGTMPLNTALPAYFHNTRFYVDISGAAPLYNKTHELATARTAIMDDVDTEQVFFFQFDGKWDTQPGEGGSQGMVALYSIPVTGGFFNNANSILAITLTAPRPNGKIPKTGDGFPLNAPLLAAGFSMAGLVWLGYRRQRRTNKKSNPA